MTDDLDFDILRPNGGRDLPAAPLALKVSVRELPASREAPAHFELVGPRGELLAWGEPAMTPAIITLVRLAAAAFRLPSEELRAALLEPGAVTTEGGIGPRLQVVKTIPPHTS